jgi:pSer/pThr/pTyr-binding forkhead associated (FHA) protein
MTEHLTLGDVLYEQPDRGPYDVVHRLTTAANAPARLRRLAHARRYVTECELATQMEAILRGGLSDLVTAAWAGFEAVQTGAAKSRQHPDDPVFVPLANHRAARSYAPRLDVYLDETLVARFVLQIHAELALTGAILKLVAGRIMSIGAGSYTGTGSLSCNGTVLAHRTTGARPLPGAIALGDGIAVGGETPVRPLTLEVTPEPRTGPPLVTVDGTIVIGRHPSCDILLAEDEAVAAHHAVAYRLGELAVLEDLGSPTGTWFNGRRMRAPAILHDGDEIDIGSHRLNVTGTVGQPHLHLVSPSAA